MHIYVPYIGEDMPISVMEDIAEREGIRAEIQYIDRPKIRMAAPSRWGIPHRHYKVRLFPLTDRKRLFSLPRIADANPRRIHAVCWHGYKNFIVSLLSEFPDATIRTSRISYMGLENFVMKYAVTKMPMYFNGLTTQVKACHCSGNDLAVWERGNEYHRFPVK